MQLGLIKNFRIKIAAFFVATLFWFTIVLENNFVYDLDVRIAPVNIPESKVIANTIPQFAKVRLEDQGKNLLALRFSDEALIEVDLSGVHEEQIISLKESPLRISRSNQPAQNYYVLYPDSLTVRLAPLAEKLIPIQPEIKVSTQPGFTLVGGVKLEPDSVTIIGPLSSVEKIDRLFTINQIFADKKFSFNGKTALKPIPDSLNIDIPAVNLEFFADVQKLLETEIAGAPVQVTNVPKNLEATPRTSSARLTVVGGERLLMGLDREDFEVIIDYKDRNRESLDGYIPIVKCPAGVQVKRVVPAKIKLKVERKGRT